MVKSSGYTSNLQTAQIWQCMSKRKKPKSSEHHLHFPQIPHKHSPPFLPGLLSTSRVWYCGEPGEISWQKDEELEDKSPHFLCTRLILNLMRSLVNHWSPLTHASHCTTTSRSAAATQMRAKVSLTVQPKVLSCLSCHNPTTSQTHSSAFTGCESRSTYSIRLQYWATKFFTIPRRDT